jgi:hypothetical protein
VERAMRWIFWPVRPIMALAWALEWVYNRVTGRYWYFGLWSASVYFLALFLASIALVVTSSWWSRGVALYILFALQVIAWASVAVVPLGNRRGYYSLLREVTRRPPRRSRDRDINLDQRALWVAISSYLYTTFFFGAVSFALSLVDSQAYTAVEGLGTGLRRLFEFVYMSFVMMVTANFVEVAPNSVAAKVLGIVEFSIGLVFTLLIFSLFVDKIVKLRATPDEG